jgi:metal-sulfur cluster biosynthetic enzyme
VLKNHLPHWANCDQPLIPQQTNGGQHSTAQHIINNNSHNHNNHSSSNNKHYVMSDEPINANPEVKDVSQLPTRQTPGVAAALPHDAYRHRIASLVSKYSFDEVDTNSEENESADESGEEVLDAQEVYDLISSISDPEHPLTLGQLSVVNLNDINVQQPDFTAGRVGEVTVQITPTITHCSLATLIGLGIRVRLDRSVSRAYRIGVYVKKGSHQSEGQVNKQLNDKERVCAACENPQLVKVVGRMLSTCVI